MVAKKCTKCGKTILSVARERSNEFVLKIRFLKFTLDGGPVSVKCRHCGQMVRIQFLKAIN